MQGYGRVEQSSGGIPPSFDSGSGGQTFGSQSGGQTYGQSGGQSGGQSFGGQSGGQSFGVQSGGQPGTGGQSYGGQSTGQGFGGQSGGQGAGSKYNAGQALADQGVADQAAFVGSKTVGHHDIPHYDKEDPKLPAAVGAMSGSGMAQKGGASGRGDNLPSQDQVTAATEGQPTGQVLCLASCQATPSCPLATTLSESTGFCWCAGIVLRPCNFWC